MALFARPALALALLSLLAFASAPTPLAAEEPAPSLAALKARIETAYANKEYAQALAAAQELRDAIDQQRIDLLYRIASLHALSGDKEAAYSALQESLDAGFWDFAGLRKDDDFASIRDEERFRSMVRGAWSRQYIAMLERPERESFQKPNEVMAALALRPGDRVADIGAGSGYFTVRLAKAVAPGGVVLALDIRQEMLDYLAARLEEERIDNVRLRLVPADDPQLSPASVDTILLVDTIHYIKEITAYATRLRAALAPGGRIVVIDYRPKPWEERNWGPPPEQQLPRERLDAAFAAAGLKPVRTHDFLPEQYFVEYRAD